MPDRPNRSLSELLAGAQRGDEEALDQLIRAIEPRVVAFLSKRLQASSARRFIDDVVAEVLARVYKHHRKARATTDRAVGAWVLTIATNEVKRLLERNPMSYAVLLHDLDPAYLGVTKRAHLRPGSYHPTEEPPRSEGLEAALEVLQRAEKLLGGELRELLYEKLVEDRSWLDIASRLAIEPSAAKRRFQRAMDRLEGLVEEGLEELPQDQRQAARTFLGIAVEQDEDEA